MKTFNEIAFEKTEMPKGIQSILNFGQYDLSIIQSDFSYGGKQGLYEIAVYEGQEQVELPGITEEGDTVKGFLTEDNVMGIIAKMHSITGVEV